MKIEALRIRNLASLAGTQPELRFGQNGLAGGLVAVTGPTGSGKSTILDALCLALFGNTPRFAEDQGNFEGGVEYNIITRGAADAFAEVDFFDNKNRHLRAKWSVAKTRTGKLQPVAMTLVDLDTGESLAQNKNSMRAAINECLGMDFSQFNGVVVLSQGSFSAFLRGDTHERSELLQRLTGTSIYEDLSKAAFLDYSRRRGFLEQGEAGLQGLHVLGAEELAQLQTQQRELSEKGVKLKIELDQRRTLSTQLRELLIAQKGFEKLKGEEGLLAQEVQSHATEQRRLEISQRCEPLRQPLEEERKSRANLSVQKQKNDQLRRDVLAQEAIIKKQKKKLLQTGSQAHQHWLALQSKVASLAIYANADEITCNALRQLSQSKKKDEHTRHLLTAELTSLKNELTKLEQKKAELRESLSISKKTLEDTAQEVLGCREQLKIWEDENGDLGHLQAEIEKIRQVSQGLSDYRHGQIDTDKQFQQLKDLDQSLNILEGELERLGVKVVERRQSEKDSSQLLQRLLRVADLVGHRQLLSIGEACPLCDNRVVRIPEGQVHHEISLAQEACEATTNRLKEVELELRGAEQRRHQALAKKEALYSQILGSQETVKLHHQRLSTLLTELRLGYAIEVLRAEDLEMEAQQRRQRLQEHADHYQRLIESEKRKETARSSTEYLRLQENGCTTNEASLRAKLEQLQRQETQLSINISDLSEQLNHGLGALAQAVGQIIEKDCSLWLEDLSKIHREWKELKDQCRDRQAELDPLLENLRSEILAVGESLADSENADQENERKSSTSAISSFADLAELPRLILSLTKGFREYREQQRKSIQIQAECSATEKQCQNFEEQYQKAIELVEQGLVNVGISDRDAALRALLSQEEMNRLEKLRRSIEQRQSDLTGRVRLSEEQLQRASLALGILRPSNDEVDVKMAELSQGIAQLELDTSRVNEELGRIGLSLEIDTSNRVKISGMQVKLEALRRDVEDASILRDLIGSAKGEKFRRFAQQLTLEQLIYYANQRLARFAPRYQLAGREELKLDVIDKDLADVQRPAATLSGGETFLVSLALALGLADLKGGADSVGSVFIDEGFGSLDSESLDTALATLEDVQNELGAQVIVISHVGELQDRWTDHVRVRRLGRGQSWIVIPGGSLAPPSIE